jgi:DNA helicase-2/ATP-dependent DNA helicase PcrA
MQSLYEALTNQPLSISETIELVDSLQLQHFEPVRQLVTLSTIHAAKGLEWRKVYILGANEGLLPFRMAQTHEQLEEERRLCYVGVSRAKQSLHISYVGQEADLSRFLKGLVDKHNQG